MKRSRLKNIINKSNTISNKQEVGDPFDEFKKSLPIEIDDNYRLEAAWKAYGSPSNFKEAMWDGLIQPIDENNYKLPSIGYNEETEEYEYLNKGKENETVDKDIRVWDNDVIPFVQELKLGGYVRTFNEEKDCWTYTKNSQKREQSVEDKGEQVIDSFQKGGKPKLDSKESEEYIKIENSPGLIKLNKKNLDQDQLLGKKPVGELGGQELYLIGDKVFFKKDVPQFKQGGQMSVIPEGALHARKNNMEGAGEDFTAKGIPVVDNDGEQQAEIEKEEIIFSKSVTDKVEDLFKKYESDETSQSEKDEIAIKMGKIITRELMTNTDDRTGLIEDIANDRR